MNEWILSPVRGEWPYGPLWYARRQWQGKTEAFQLGLGGPFNYAGLDCDGMVLKRDATIFWHGVTHSERIHRHPSEVLWSLLDSLPDHKAHFAVLDKLIEEYPEFEPQLMRLVSAT